MVATAIRVETKIEKITSKPDIRLMEVMNGTKLKQKSLNCEKRYQRELVGNVNVVDGIKQKRFCRFTIKTGIKTITQSTI